MSYKEIFVIYETNEKKTINIFGKNFVENNKENVQLIIDKKEINLTDVYEIEGKKEITLKILKDLTDLSFMFNECENLVNINGLQFLNTKEVTSLKCLFSGCKSLEDIDALKTWDVSKVTLFNHMLFNCEKLKNIKPLQKWNVSSGINFNCFLGKTNISDISPLSEWNVSKGENFRGMFCSCSILENRKYKSINEMGCFKWGNF